jgi:fructosamine-3-kinase
MSLSEIAKTGAALLGGGLRSTRLVAGGSLSQVFLIELTDGRKAIVKGGPDPELEAEMLAAIAASGAPAPRVLAVSGDTLVMEHLAAGGSLSDAWADLGRAVATLHATTGDRFGWRRDYAFSHVAIENLQTCDWPGFWAEHRLLPHAAHLPARLACRLEALAGDIGNRLPDRPVASLLHGDLWTGNVLADCGRVTGLIDPACCYGHAEVDIAMLSLFGSPSRDFFSAYGGLEPGHEERIAIYSLWPALVHVRLFGQGYEPMVARLLSVLGV